MDVIGFKSESGEWNGGSFQNTLLEKAEATNLLWYRQALIDFNNHIHSIPKIAEGAKERLKRKKGNKITTPMVESSYDTYSSEPIDPYSGGMTSYE